MRKLGSIAFLLFLTVALVYVGFHLVAYAARAINGEVDFGVSHLLLGLILLGGCVSVAIVVIHSLKALFRNGVNREDDS